jgi:hypothetical protein
MRKTIAQRLQLDNCRKLPNDATAQEIADMHKIKLGKKARLRQRYIPDPEHIFANISVNHPDYGMTPREHAAAKAARANT